MRFRNENEAITYVFESLAASDWRGRGLDEDTRDLTPTERLLAMTNLPPSGIEFAVVTGSKGKGSVTAITAKLLQSLGHTVGMVTSPHLTTYRQRFRVNGKMITEETLARLISELAPAIDRVKAGLSSGQYLSPQGIFLAVALKWFVEQAVTAAVIEVGRGGRFDDNALVPNKLSLFTPMILEHTRYLGETLERIAWHKSGIIKPNSYAYSLPQAIEVLDVLRREADRHGATFEWIAPVDMGHYLGMTPDGIRADFGRYGEVELPLLGRYEIDNASLAIWGAGNMHSRIRTAKRIPHGSPEYVERIRSGLEAVIWPGRCQKMQESPQVFVDGAINVLSARSYISSIRERLTEPVVVVLAVPTDRDVAGVYGTFAPLSDTLVITETRRNITINFPAPEDALATGRRFFADVTHTRNITRALDVAREKAGESGTVVMSLAQPAIGDLMAVYGLTYEVI